MLMPSEVAFLHAGVPVQRRVCRKHRLGEAGLRLQIYKRHLWAMHHGESLVCKLASRAMVICHLSPVGQWRHLQQRQAARI